MMTNEQAARIEQELASDDVYYAGRARGRKLHLIAGASKAVRQPNSICGQWVSNTHRQPSAAEIDGNEICSRCQKGQRVTAFSSVNQPRPCGVCGRVFADSAYRDSTDQTCPDCYEEAGYINAHDDGHHNDAADPNCPSCAAETVETAVETDQPAPVEEAAPVATDDMVSALLLFAFRDDAARLFPALDVETVDMRKHTMRFTLPDGRMVTVAVAVE